MSRGPRFLKPFSVGRRSGPDAKRPSGLWYYLVEVSELGDLVPEVPHDLLVVGVGIGAEFATALDQGVPDGKALEVVLIQEAIVVNV